MSAAATDRHNALARKFMRGIVAQALADGASSEDILILAETAVLAALLSGERIFGVSRRESVERLDVLTVRVMERLAAEAGP